MHYHCTECSATIERKCRFQSHLEKHFRSSKKIHPLNKDDIGLKKLSSKKDKQVLEEKTVVSRRQLNIERVECDICKRKVTKKNMNRHYKRWHNQEYTYTAVCCDKYEGFYMVKKSSHGGVSYPLHVQKSLKSGLIDYEDERCREEMATAVRSGMNGRECSHLMLVNNAFYPQPFTLNEGKLFELASNEKYRVLSEETVNTCIELKHGCDFYNHPLVVAWEDQNHIHLSVYNSKYMHIPIRSRCIVSYNS